MPCSATVTISGAIETAATLHYGIGKANNRNDKIERWTRRRRRRRTPHFPPSLASSSSSDIALSRSVGRFRRHWKRLRRRVARPLLLFPTFHDVSICLLFLFLPSYSGCLLWETCFRLLEKNVSNSYPTILTCKISLCHLYTILSVSGQERGHKGGGWSDEHSCSIKRAWLRYARPTACRIAEAAKNSFSEVFVKEQLNLLNIWNFWTHQRISSYHTIALRTHSLKKGARCFS